jgi:hypothetical protein
VKTKNHVNTFEKSMGWCVNAQQARKTRSKYKVLVGNYIGGDHLENSGVNGRIILKRIILIFVLQIYKPNTVVQWIAVMRTGFGFCPTGRICLTRASTPLGECWGFPRFDHSIFD